MSDYEDSRAAVETTSTSGFFATNRWWLFWMIIFSIVGASSLQASGKEPTETISQARFLQLLEFGRIQSATIYYNNQSALNDITGIYSKDQGGSIIAVPFRTRVKLSQSLENRLTSLPQFEVREPNNVLLSVIWSVLPILVIAAFIWFFFIRQMKKSGAFDIQKRAIEQMDRYDKILEKWEEQTKRMDDVINRLGGNK